MDQSILMRSLQNRLKEPEGTCDKVQAAQLPHCAYVQALLCRSGMPGSGTRDWRQVRAVVTRVDRLRNSLVCPQARRGYMHDDVHETSGLRGFDV